MTAAAGPILIPVDNPGPMTGAGTSTWLLDGAVPTLIDAGPGDADHLEAIAGRLRGRDLGQVLVTHGHHDHAAGAPGFRGRWPGARLRKYPPLPDAGWQGLADGEQVPAGDRTLTVVHTPGHAADHVCFWDAAGRDLFAGDMVLAGTTVMIPGGAGGGLRDYLASLERLASLGPRRLFPGHGGVITDPVKRIRAYVHHRLMRETEVLRCLERGMTDLDAMVRHIYPDLEEGVRPAARQTLVAHLEKLRDEGRMKGKFDI